MAQTEDPAQLRANEIAKALKGPVQEAIRRVERLGEDFPSDKDFHFYNNFLQFNSPVRSILSQAEALLNDIGLAKNLRREPGAFPIRDPDEAYDWLVALQDDLVEGIDAAVDQLNKETSAGKRGRANNEVFETPRTGVKSDGSSPSAGANKATKGSSERRPVPFHVKSIPRPQNKFEIAVDNSNTPFKHPQAPKAHAQEEGLSALDLHARKLGATFEDMHPLEDEITRMAYVDPQMLEEPVPQEPRPIAETPLTVVSTLLELNEMAAKCRLAGEIAVDLENHHYRSFQGFVCLMQVSTRAEDFIVDTLALRSQISPCLKDIFADSRIRKVLHGADRDIVWLQRDFGIYVCNMFDTGQAARVLQLEGFGLAFLMQHFLKMNPDKRYQLADWRIRPLPAEMIKYAREDTHYLLYLYDLLRVQLVSMRSTAENDVEDPLLQVYKRSCAICLLMYKKDILTETSYLSLYGLQDRQFSPAQMSVLAGLYAWRDKLARKLDESTGFVLPNQLLYKLAEEMPDTARTLQNMIRGPHSLVGQHAAEVLEVIKQSKEKPVMSAPNNTSSSVLEQSSTSVTEASDGLTAEMETVNTITTQATKTVSDAVLEIMEEDVEPVSANGEDVDMKSTTVVELDVQEQEQSCANSKAEVGEISSIKEITVGPSMSTPQGMVTRTSVDDTNPASTISIRKLNTAVVKRASVPSLALFGGSSKKKSPALNVGSITKTKPIETKPIDAKPVETLSRPATSSSMTDSEVSKLSNAVIEDIPEGVIVTAVLDGADDGKGASAWAAASSTFALSEKDLIMGAAGVAEQAVEVKEPAGSPLESEGGTASVISEVMLGTNLAVGGGLTEHEQENKSVAVAEAPSQDAGRLNEPCGTDATPKPLSEDVIMVAAEEEKACDPSAVSPGGSAAVESNPPVAVVNSRRVVSGAAARQGLGSMLGSSAHRKRQKRSNEDMEMVAAKLRAHRIQASVSLPFQRVPSLGEQDTQMLSTPISAEPGKEPVSNASPSQPASSLKQEADPFEELGDYVTVGSENRSAYDVATKTSSNRSEEERPFPTTLNQMRRRPRGKHPADSSLTPNSNQKQQHKKQKSKSSPANNVESTTAEEAVLFQPFDYEAARREAGLGDNLVLSRKEEGESGRGRGRGRPVNPNKRQKQVAPPSTGGPVQAFDPLRRARQEPRPEGIPAAKRRQVFPQTGNRTASFRR